MKIIKDSFKDIPYVWWVLQALAVFAITFATSKSFLGAYLTTMVITIGFSTLLKQTTGKFLFEGIVNARQGKNN